MKKYLFIIFILLLQLTVSGQEDLTQTIRGTVVDAVAGYPLPGANIILEGTSPDIVAMTDGNGVFVLTGVPVGRQSIEISFLGYHPKTINNILLSSGKELVLEIKLDEKVVEVDEVVIKSSKPKTETLNEMALISSRSFSVEETERYAGSLGDPARMVANYAGVMTQNDSRNDIIIRGNSPIGLLWRLEGIEIPNPNHFGALGTTGGPVSMLNNNLLTNSDFLTGAFPAEYGNAISGAFDLNMRSGNRSKTEYTGQVGFNGFELGAEGPFLGKNKDVRPSYLINGRYSTLQIMQSLGFSFGTGFAVPQYKDIAFIVDIPGTKLGRFKVIGIAGESYIELGRDKDDTTGNSYNTRGTATNFNSNLAVLGLSHLYYFNEKARIRSILSVQQTSSKTILDSVTYSPRIEIPYFRGGNLEAKLSYSVQFSHKLSSKDNYSFGAIFDYYFVDYLDSINSRDYGKFIKTRDLKGNMFLLRGYGQWQHKFNDNVTSYAGLHCQYFLYNKEMAVEPRLGLKWQFHPKQSVNFGFGMHSQIQPKSVYLDLYYDSVSNIYYQTNKDIKFSRSNHYVIGYNYLINKDFRFRAETYYQHLYNVPVKEGENEFSLINAGDLFYIASKDSMINKGLGMNYGIELTLEKFLSKGYYFLFTSSVFDSKYKGYEGDYRNTSFNGNYVFNLLAGYEYKLGKSNFLTFDIKTVWAGGRRYIPVDVEKSVANNTTEYNYSDAYKNKYDDYFRTDLRIGFKMNKTKYTQEWAVDLQNITGFKSTFMEGYDIRKREFYKTYQQGFMPMVLYRIQF